MLYEFAMLVIRTATRDDAARLSAFARRMFHETFAADNAPDDMAAYLSEAFNEARQLAEIVDSKTVTLIAEENARFVAYAQLREAPPPASVPDCNAIELVRFYVDRACHGRGIAQALMKAVDDAAGARASAMWLGVWERNRRAIAFYAKCGFIDVGSHVFELGRDQQTDRIMWRSRIALPDHP